MENVQQDFGAFNDTSEILERAFRDTQPVLDRALFHYTTLEAFKAIIESGAMWATHIAFLNDSSELDYGRSLFAEIVRESLVTEASQIGREFLDRCTRWVEPFGPWNEYYVTCFCEDEDLLSQWRGYGHRGAGCSLGFVPQELNGGAGPIVLLEGRSYALQGLLRKVVYDRDLQVAAIRNAVDSTLKRLRELALSKDQGRHESFVGDAVRCINHHVSDFCLVFKNPAFREENEWRAIYPFNSDPPSERNAFARFRTTGSQLVPYLEICLGLKAGPRAGKFPLSTMTLGPTSTSKLAQQALRRFLLNRGFEHVSINTSVIPLR